MNVAGLKKAIRHHLDSKPAPTGIEFKMIGPKLAFSIGNQCFTLDYEPDSDEEAEFMKRMLCHAISGFAPDVKTDAQPARAPLPASDVIELIDDAGLDWHAGWTVGEDSVNRYLQLARGIERAHGIGEAGNG
jgi:hypothetical protein